MDDLNAGKKQQPLRDQLEHRDSVSRICSPSNADSSSSSSSRPCSFCCKNGRGAVGRSSAEAISKFPPPLTILAGDCCYSRFPYCMPRGGLRPIRKNGRFLLQEVRVPKQLMFHSVRKNGRLVLLLLLKNDEQMSTSSSRSTSSSSLSFLDEEQSSSSSSPSSCSSGGISSLEEESAPASQSSGGLFTKSAAQSAFSCDSAASFSEESQAPVESAAGHLVVAAHGIAIVDSSTNPPLSIPNCPSAGRFTIIEATSIAAQFPYGKPNNSKLCCSCCSSSSSSMSSSSSSAAAIVEIGNSCGASQWNSTKDFRFQAILPWTH